MQTNVLTLLLVAEPSVRAPEGVTVSTATAEPLASAGKPGDPIPAEPAAAAQAAPLKPGTSSAAILDLSAAPTTTSSALSSISADWTRDERYRAKSTASGKYSQSSIERKRQHTTRIIVAGGVLGLLATAYHLGRPWESETERRKMGGSEASEGGSPMAHIERAKARALDSLDVRALCSTGLPFEG